MLYRSHRGCLYYAPENTMPAFKMAFEKNFVVSWITLSNDIPFNKIDVVYLVLLF